MKVSALIQTLETYNSDAEVCLATQPDWGPFEYSVGRVEGVSGTPGTAYVGAIEDVVYLSEGVQLGCLPGAARVALGWS